MTRFLSSVPSGRAALLRRVLLVLGMIVVVGLVAAACDPIQPSLLPGATPAPGASPVAGASAPPTAAPSSTPAPTPLIVRPAEIKADPVSLLAALFNPVFQAFLLLMIGIHVFTRFDMGVSIILTTLIVRTAMVPLMRRQMVSMRKMQSVAPEIKEIQRRFKADRVKQQQATMALYKERGISQAGCLVALLPLLLILPMYQVVSEGLRAADLTESLKVFGVQLVPLTCPPPVLATLADGTTAFRPCIDSAIPWLGGILASGHQGLIPFGFTIPLINMTGISLFALVYTALQLVASRMALPPHDPANPPDQNARTQRALAIWLPLITILYGNIIPVGVFIYLIVSTVYQIVQQFFTTGWGGMFPLFGRTPAFAVDHKPRFPVAVPTAPTSTTTRPEKAPARPNPDRSSLDRAASADATIRHRGRQGRRGRRR
jgi:YidC/Oxa1 family membrane protein insertase